MQPRPLPFGRSNPDAVALAIDALRAAGLGWVNLRPDLGEDLPPPPKPSMFSGRGPLWPLITVSAGARSRRASMPTMVGIEHGNGPRARQHLAKQGLDIYPGWLVRQDHGKRGLVLAVPDTTTSAEILTWALAAAGSLCRYNLPETWHADVWS